MTKKSIYFILTVLLLFTVFSCKKEDKQAFSSEPEIVSIWPKSGNTSTIVRIIGYNFSSIRTENKVQINGKDATVIEATPTELQVVPPEGTGSGKVTITIDGKEITGSDFTYKEPMGPGTIKADSFYVKTGGSGDGSSWNKATSLEDALGNAGNGSIIFVAAGTYTPSKTITGGSASTKEDQTFEIKKNFTIKGGYPANVSDIKTPADPSANATILSGDLSGTNAYHVMAIIAPKVGLQQVVIDGLTITGGWAFGSTSKVAVNGTEIYRNGGGGIMIGNSKVEIKDCKINNNKSRQSIAGIFIVGGSDVTIENSQVNGNESGTENTGNGAGIWVQSSKLAMYNSEVKNNKTNGTGPGVYGYPNSSVNLFNTTVADNEGGSYGAAVYIRESSKTILLNCLIYGNHSGSTNGGGGLMMYNNCDAIIISSTITQNNISGPGGGVYRKSGTSSLAVYNSIISGNQQTGVDVDDDGSQPAPKVESSVIGTQAYDNSGAEVGSPFDPDAMFESSFKPKGSNDPALSYGMSANDLNTLGNANFPSVESAYLIVDVNENSRSGINIMGAVVQ